MKNFNCKKAAKKFKVAGVGIARRISSNEKETSHPVGLAVRICGSHPQGPGSTPGLGTFLNPSQKYFTTLAVRTKLVNININLN